VAYGNVGVRRGNGARAAQPRALDLFAGCGGLTQGLRVAGFSVVGAIEIDPLAVETYRENHPGVVVWSKDIAQVTTEAVKRRLALRRGELDLLAGCPPCQGFSVMRTLNGGRRIPDRRNDLVFEFLRFAKGLLPKTIMLENVPALAADPRMDRLVHELRLAGYSLYWDVLDAADFGVPQRRKRLILLGSRLGLVEPARRSRRKKTVRDAIGQLAVSGFSGDQLHDLPERRNRRVHRLIRRIPPNGGSRADLGRRSQLACHQRCDGFKDVYGRMQWDDVAPTITSGCVNPSKGRFLHPVEHRSITLREAALLQSFPSGYAFSLSRGKFAAAAMIGNALPPEFVRRHALALRRHLVSR
jgi:DNA (cytosine-5)-methyltransferase 1